MSFSLVENVDFGTAEMADYMYVNYCQGPDLYKFRMSPEAARPFMEKIDAAVKGMNAVRRQLDPEAEPLEQAAYEAGDGENEGSIVFTALLLDAVAVDGKWMPENQVLDITDNMDSRQKPRVICDLIVDQYDDVSYVGLELKELRGVAQGAQEKE